MTPEAVTAHPTDLPLDQRPAPQSVPLVVDLRTAIVLAAAYGVAAAVTSWVLLPFVMTRTVEKLPLPAPLFSVIVGLQVTVVYGLLAWAGLRLARRRDLEPAPVLTGLLTRRQLVFSARGWFTAAALGLLCGAALLAAVRFVGAVFPGTLPSVMHPPGVAGALSASTAAAFGEEILCRLFILSAVLALIPKGKPSARIVANITAAIIFGVLHLPGMIALAGGVANVPHLSWAWVVGLNAMVGLVFGLLYLRHGIGAAITGHWFCDLAWHVGSALL